MPLLTHDSLDHAGQPAGERQAGRTNYQCGGITAKKNKCVAQARRGAKRCNLRRCQRLRARERASRAGARGSARVRESARKCALEKVTLDNTRRSFVAVEGATSETVSLTALFLAAMLCALR